MDDRKETPNRRMQVQSVEVGMRLLIKLSRLGATVSLSQLSLESQMPPSKVHRYLRSLMNTGFVTQDEDTSLYRLGPEALALGFAAMGHLDAIAASSRILAELRDQINQTCILCVWGNRGPAVVRIEPAARSIVVNIRMGSIMPVLTSASGLIYAAFLKDQSARDIIQFERQQLSNEGKINLLEQAEFEISRARETGIATVRNVLTRGVSAVAAPIFDHQGHLEGAITALGPDAQLDVSLEGSIARAVYAAAASASRALGYNRPLGHS